MTEDSDASDSSRRRVLKTLAAAGIAGTGIVGASGSAAADPSDHAQNPENPPGRSRGSEELSFDVEKSGTIVEETDVVNNENFPVNEDANVDFDGQLVLTGLDVNESNELVASGRLKGKLKRNPTQNINETFENVVLGALEDVLGLLSPGEAGECPVLDLDVGEIFLDLLGLQLETSVIEIDLTAVAGEGNLLGNLLCAVAGLLDP